MEEIKSIYEDNCRWLTFAEAKHTVLIALNTALLALLMTKDARQLLNNHYIVIVLLCLCSMSISVSSLLPFSNQNKILNSIVCKYYSRSNSVDNVIFYKEIFLMETQYFEKLKEKTGISEYTIMEREWIKQIMEISSIATIKVALFKLAGILLMADILFLGYSLILINFM